jgi:hypothetical protein
VINILDPHIDFSAGLVTRGQKLKLRKTLSKGKESPGSNMDFSDEHMAYKAEYYKVLPIKHNSPPPDNSDA